jgi:hypothetical protein
MSKSLEMEYLCLFCQSRTAARKELLNQMSSPDECEKRYEEALWCLYTLRDDIAPEGQTSLAGDQNMVDYGSIIPPAKQHTFSNITPKK